MFKFGAFYRTTVKHALMASDRAAPATYDWKGKKGGRVMLDLPVGELVMVTKTGRWRYVQVLCRDMIGWIWLPTNLATHMVFDSVTIKEE
jgi:hypothetical protein